MAGVRDTYEELVARWKALRGSRDVRVREVACEGVARTLLCVECGAHDAPAITVAAGVHGDEPAGPRALLAWMEVDAADPRFAYRLWPIVNPSGLALGTRENAEALDINRTFGRGGTSPEARAMLVADRDRRFELALDLHEDRDAEGFYCYEYGCGDVGLAVVRAIDEAGLPIASFKDGYRFDPPLPAERSGIERGIVRPDPEAEAAVLGGRSLSLVRVRRGVPRVLTLEAPGRRPLDERITALVTAVRAAIAALADAGP